MPNTQTTHGKGLTVNTTQNIQPAPNIAPTTGLSNVGNQPMVNASPANVPAQVTTPQPQSNVAPTQTPQTASTSGTLTVPVNTTGPHHTQVPKVKGRSSLRRASFAPMVSIYTPVSSSTTSTATGNMAPSNQEERTMGSIWNNYHLKRSF